MRWHSYEFQWLSYHFSSHFSISLLFPATPTPGNYSIVNKVTLLTMSPKTLSNVLLYLAKYLDLNNKCCFFFYQPCKKEEVCPAEHRQKRKSWFICDTLLWQYVQVVLPVKTLKRCKNPKLSPFNAFIHPDACMFLPTMTTSRACLHPLPVQVSVCMEVWRGGESSLSKMDVQALFVAHALVVGGCGRFKMDTSAAW